MSHKATNWAFEQPQKFRDMLPSELVCLLALADCHNPAAGCFPSHEYIADVTNLSRRAVIYQLQKLRARGLIAWDASRENGRQGSNRYSLAFEKDFRVQNLHAVSECKIEGVQSAKSDNYRVQNLHTNPVRKDNRKEPLRADAREGEGDFSFFWDKWDALHRPDNRHYCLVLWQKLSPEAKRSARDTYPTYVRFCALRKRKPVMVPYLRDRIFAELDGGPPFDKDGDFIITPSREEWSAWMGDARAKYGERGVTTHTRLGKFCTKTRWPDAVSAAG